jgi:hypothetical protein
LRFEIRRDDGSGLAAGLDITLGGKQGIGGLDGAPGETQLLGQRSCRWYPVARLQHTAGDGAAEAIVDLPVKRRGRRWIERRDIARPCAGHGSSTFFIWMGR